jgi:hypothetical protein
MSKSEILPKEIRDRLRHIVVQSGLKPDIVDEDPVKVLDMLLYAVGDEIDRRSPYTTLWGLVQEYCSAEGLVRFARHLREKKIA